MGHGVLGNASGGVSEVEGFVFRYTVEMGDRLYKAFLDTGARLSIVARRLLKQARIRKIKTVAISVGDGRTIHSLVGVDLTACLVNRKVTHHCRMPNTDALADVLFVISQKRLSLWSEIDGAVLCQPPILPTC